MTEQALDALIAKSKSGRSLHPRQVTGLGAELINAYGPMWHGGDAVVKPLANLAVKNGHFLETLKSSLALFENPDSLNMEVGEDPDKWIDEMSAYIAGEGILL